MIKRMIGVLGTLGVVAIVVLTILGRAEYSSAIDFAAAPTAECAEPTAMEEPRPASSEEVIPVGKPDSVAVDPLQ